MINHALLMLAAILCFHSTGLAQLSPGEYQRTVQVDDLERDYNVYLPQQYRPDEAWPVVIVFHGGGSRADSIQSYTEMDKKAEQEGFLVVYPEGTGRFARVKTWNGGECCGYAKNNNIEDVAFVDQLLDDLESVASIDQKRIYCTGISNGAIISYYLADQLSHRIAAIAPISGPMSTEQCNPSNPVSIIHFHGTNDQFARYEGGYGSRSLGRTNFRSVEHSISAWVKANKCQEQPVIETLPDSAEDGTSVTRHSYPGGKNGTEVVLYQIHEGGHTWPGKPSPTPYLGTICYDISANDLMWDFFKNHPKP